MTIEHTLLGVYLLAIGSGVFTGMTINFCTYIFKKRQQSGAYSGH